MEAKLIARYALLVVVVLFYLVKTFRFSLLFSKNNYFTGGKKVFHAVMIWVVPFLWMTLLKSILKPNAGSASYSKRKFDSAGITESEVGFLGYNSAHHHGGNTAHHSSGADSFDGDSDGGGAGADSSSVD